MHPGALHSHTAILESDKMYIFGGKVGPFTSSNKIHSFDFKT